MQPFLEHKRIAYSKILFLLRFMGVAVWLVLGLRGPEVYFN